MCAELPVITSIYPNSPVVLHTYSKFIIPVGYSGAIFSCTAFGWPIPFVEWLKDGQTLAGRVRSEFIRIANSAFVSARLIWEDGFYPFDAGNYTCIVRDLSTSQIITHSKIISVDSSRTSSSTIVQRSCTLDSLTAYFQIRVLDTNCLSWEVDSDQQIASDISSVVQSSVSSECHHCITASDTVEIVGLKCSKQVKHAALLRGVIRTEQVNLTESIFCALSRWKQNGPLLLLNGSSHFVDQDCDLVADSIATSECFATLNSSTGFLFPNKLLALIHLIIASFLLLH